jgi:phytoene desaturase
MPAKIGIVGAGPGGIASAMLLAAKGFNVTVFESAAHVGGRTSSMQVGHTKFDVGPTILMMKFVLDQIFKESNRNVSDYLKLRRLNPMYRLQFGPDKYINCHDITEQDKMVNEMKRVFPKDADSYTRYLKYESERYEKLMPLLQKPYANYKSLVNMDSIRALPHLGLGKSIHNLLGGFFEDPLAKISFSFQSKYLGMSPWDCPAFFGLIPYVEHAYGVWHVDGGLSEIPVAMSKVFQEYGGELKLSTPVKKLIIKDRAVKGILTEEGEQMFDEVILNADFGMAVEKLIPDAENILKTWKPSYLRKKKFSCSTFMYYIALDKVYPELAFHTISFANDYRSNVNVITGHSRMPEDFSIYIRNSSILDPTVSPTGQSGLYVLVPVPNLQKPTDDWQNAEVVQRMKEMVIKHIETRCGAKDLRNHIVAEKIITPTMWRDERNIFNGATFSLAHNILQLLLWRPRNKFQDLNNLYLVGAGTHPGSGLPTIWESARIATQMLTQKYGVQYEKVRYANYH